MQKHTYIHNEPLILESGDCLPRLEIAYHTAGRYDSTVNNVIWVCHALTANSDPSDWWKGMVGEGKFYNPAEHFIICANIIGSCYGTTGPLSVNPGGNEAYYNNFPLITIRDMVKVHEVLRLHLGIKHIHTLIGSSIGAFQALEWSIIQPDIFDYMIFIASGCKVSPWFTAFNESQRAAIRTDRTFFSRQPDGGLQGMEVARSIALLSYRSYSGYNSTQQEEDTDFIEAVKASSYQRYQGEKLGRRFNAYSYYSLTRSIDSHNVGRGREGIKKALAQVKAYTLLIAISSDILFPPEEMEFMHRHLLKSDYCCIHSAFGHDGFLIEYRQLQQVIYEFYKNNQL
ncbi:MAG: homoserine O-acetyltransferase [Prevotellaceae bacterium]|jgi:homoserine O-acetyltransferase|nr:homoserine O-acetyltransferase [Prevotellaceae bacterium]